MISIKKLLIIPSVLALFTSCDPLETLGPGLCPDDDFSFDANDLKVDVVSKSGANFVFTDLGAASNTVDLDGEGLHIHAKLTDVVKWELEITMDDGSTSKSYSGESDSVSIYWYGNSKKMPLFSGGKAKLKFEILCVEEVNKELTLINTPTFKDIHTGYGILVRDWDENGSFDVPDVTTPDFTFGSGSFLWANVATASVNYLNTDPSPMGGYYINLYSKEDAPDWYHFATGINGGDLDEEVEKFSTLNADSVYLNFYARGDQQYKNTSLEISYSGNESGIWTEHLNWEGWKMVSIPLSEFRVGTSSMTTAEGLSYIAMQLGCQPQQDDEAQYDLDFLIITVGSPFFDE